MDDTSVDDIATGGEAAPGKAATSWEMPRQAVAGLCCAALGIGAAHLSAHYGVSEWVMLLLGAQCAAAIGGWVGGLLCAALVIACSDWFSHAGVSDSSTWNGFFPLTVLATALITGWCKSRTRRVQGQLTEMRREFEDQVRRRTAHLSSAVKRLNREISSRRRAQDELRSVAAHTGCILWHAEVDGPCQDTETGGTPCLNWNVHVQDERAAQLVLPLDIPEGGTYFKAWTRARNEADALAVGRVCTDAVFSGKRYYSNEYRCQDRTGQERWLYEDVRIYSEGPGKWRLFGVTTDITDRKHANQALEESERRFALFMQHLPGIAFIRNARGEFVFVNEEGRAKGIGQTAAQGRDEANATFARLTPVEEKVLARRESRQSLEVVSSPEGERYFVFNHFAIPSRDSIPLLGAVAIDITERRHAEEELLAHQQKLRALTAKVSMTEESERRRLASVLHDDIGGLLAVTQIRLQTMLQLGPSANVGTIVPEILADLEQAIRRTRSLTCEISPPLLYEAGLAAALEWLGDQVRHRFGLIVQVDGDPEVEKLPQESKAILYHGVRELLTNVIKHAKAAKATITLIPEDGFVSVSVRDDGVGIQQLAQRRSDSFGLFSLRERIQYLGGRLIFESIPEQGTAVTIVLPSKSRANQPRAQAASA